MNTEYKTLVLHTDKRFFLLLLQIRLRLYDPASVHLEIRDCIKGSSSRRLQKKSHFDSGHLISLRHQQSTEYFPTEKNGA